MHVLLFSKDGHVRTLINKCIKEKCVLVSTKEQLERYLIINKDVDFFVLDELLITKYDIKFLFFEYPKAKIIFLLTGKKGDYLQSGRFFLYSKPLTINKFNSIFKNNEIKLDESKKDYNSNCLIGSSSIMSNLRKEINLLSLQDCPVMLVGESGTGKEVASKIIHSRSKYSSKNMVCVNCALLNSDISDSILFGHRKGSFTGADEDTLGLINKANYSSLFLDEIENISLASQAKLLRTLDFGEYRRIGDNSILKSSFRLICASNKNIESLILENKFRKDFYYRISMFQIRMPTLEEHKEDIEELVYYYFNLKNEKRDFEKNFIKKLKSRNWPGNVRELNNILEKSRIYSDSNTILLKD